MKDQRIKKILVIASYVMVGVASVSIAVLAASYFLAPILAQSPSNPPGSKIAPTVAGEVPPAAEPINAPAAAAQPVAGEQPKEVPMEGESSAPTPEMTIEEINKFLRVYEYDPGGRRDPFQPFVLEKPEAQITAEKEISEENLTPLERYDLDQIELLGIIWQVSKPKVMLRDPTGRVHIVGKNTKIGRNNGYIAVIREGEIVIVESFDSDGQVTYQTRIRKLSR